MPNLKEFIEVLQVRWDTASVALLGCLIMLIGNGLGIPYLSSVPEWLITVFVCVGVFAFAVLFIKVCTRIAECCQARKQRGQIIEELQNATPEEMAALSYYAKSGEQYFTARPYQGKLVVLVQKGLVIRMAGQYSTREWPHKIHDVAWKWLLENKDKLAD